jgi:Protein of unknown function (DUF1706)
VERGRSGRRYAARVTEASLRDRLLESLHRAHAQEEALIALCDDEPAPVAGQWTAKDNVAHLNAWREHATQILDAVRRGEEPEGPVDDRDLDARNAVIYEAHRGESAADVRAVATASYAALLEAVAASSEEVLLRDRPGGSALWHLVPGNGHGHVAQHVSSWAGEHDDTEGAEAVALWAYEIGVELFPEEKVIADYNFACFYGRNGRAEEALPLLRDALRASPDLVPFALEDPDLTPIRNDPRVQSLLGA